MKKLQDYAIPLTKRELDKQRKKANVHKKELRRIRNLLMNTFAKKTIYNGNYNYNREIPIREEEQNCIIEICNNNNIEKSPKKTGIKTLNNESEQLLQRKRTRSNCKEQKKCLICSWIFPLSMTQKEINYHIIKCAEGQGEQNKYEFLSSLATIFIESKSLNLIKDINCNWCNMSLPRNNKMKHLIDCATDYLKNSKE